MHASWNFSNFIKTESIFLLRTPPFNFCIFSQYISLFDQSAFINYQTMHQIMREAKRTSCDYRDVDFLQFSVFSQEQILNYSVLEIYADHFYENGHPTPGGLFDLRLGVTGPKQVCQTCGESTSCPGHFGHIKLSQPVLHYGFLWVIAQVMKCICHRCFRIKRGTEKQLPKKMKEARKIANPLKRLTKISKLLEGIKKCSKQIEDEDLFDRKFKCCNSWIPTQITIKNYRISYRDDCHQQKYFDRRQIKGLLEGISSHENECQFLGFTKTKPIDLIIQSLVVCPPQVRPYILIQNQTKCQDDLSIAYLKVLRLNKAMKSSSLTLIERAELVDQMEKIVASIMINLKSTPQSSSSKKKIKNISERLKGKQGRFRQNLLGKRVDFSARTVISPDPNIALSEVGIPEKIARNLTYPEKVTPLNFNKILDLLVEKKVKYLITRPEVGLGNGETSINVDKIEGSTKDQFRPYLNYGMVAERMLENGDYVLLNRQPTLHRMSMMAHKVRILPHQTFRINPSVCTPYNADFDGDQMNVHVPQSYQTVSQLKNVASVKSQIVGPKNGTTSMGFSQDSLLGAYLMTSRDTFLNGQDFMNLVAKLNDNEILAEISEGALPLPAIIKPEPLWTGKQLVGLLLPQQVEMSKITQTSKQMAFRNMDDMTLLIRRGQLITGTLQKEHIGSSSSLSNIIHFIWTQIGVQKAEKFINDLQQVVYNWLMATGFSIGVSDVVPEAAMVKKKSADFGELQTLYYELLNSFRDKNEVKKNHLHQQGQSIFESLQYLINLKLNNHLSKIQQEVKQSLIFRQNNNIYKIVKIKSKGSETNLAQILYSVGNQNVNGKRCPVGFSKRSLPHYCKNDSSPSARGYVLSSFYQGLKPQQFFFHSMGGREGLSDTAIKTSDVGYIQRKLVKSLEDIIVKYDGSVRDSRQSVLQHLYGEDGFSPQFIEKHHCYAAQLPPKAFRQLYKWKDQELKKLFRYNTAQIQSLKRQYSYLYKNRKMFNRYFSNNSQSRNFLYFCPITVEKIINRIRLHNSKGSIKPNEEIDPYQIYKSLEQLLSEINVLPRRFSKLTKKLNDLSKQNADNDSFSDQFQREDINKKKLITMNYCNADKIKVKQIEEFQIFQMHLRFSLSSKILHKKLSLNREMFEKILRQIKERFFRSLVPAGQSVGCLASQSIGQPTTQMTLNTFHLAGISDRNVTLGIPRLSQILNCSLSSQNSSLVIFPRLPIKSAESQHPEKQQYLLNLLFGVLPESRIGNFIVSSHYQYKSKQLRGKRSYLSKLPEGLSRTPWTITLVFSTSQIHTNHMWERIVNTIARKTQKNYQIDDMVDYHESLQNPKIVLRYLSDRSQSEKTPINFLEETEGTIKNTWLGGISGLKSVRLTKRWLNLDPQNGWKQYMAFEATGKSLRNCLCHQEVNSCKTYSNNAQQTLSVLGIEAARQTLLNQFKQVLKPYGICIHYKHLSVLLDWMCVQGVLTSVNRNGIHRSKNLSTLTKASFQKAVDILFNAAVFSEKDFVSNTSEKIIFGRIAQCGTSQCELMIDPKKSIQYSVKQEQLQNRMPSKFEQVWGGKTPMLHESVTLDHSLLGGKSSYRGGYSGRSPTMSPMLAYSPSLSPSIPNIPNGGVVSPVYRQNLGRVEPKRIEYTGRYGSSPSYNRYSESPSYSVLANLRASPPRAVRLTIADGEKDQGEGAKNDKLK